MKCKREQIEQEIRMARERGKKKLTNKRQRTNDDNGTVTMAGLGEGTY